MPDVSVEDLRYRLVRHVVLMMAAHGLPFQEALYEAAGVEGRGPRVPGAPNLEETRALVTQGMGDATLMNRAFEAVREAMNAHSPGPVTLDDVIIGYRKAAQR